MVPRGGGRFFEIWLLACLGPPITVSGLGTMWDEIPMSPASRCLNMSQIRRNLRIFEFVGICGPAGRSIRVRVHGDLRSPPYGGGLNKKLYFFLKKHFSTMVEKKNFFFMMIISENLEIFQNRSRRYVFLVVTGGCAIKNLSLIHI